MKNAKRYLVIGIIFIVLVLVVCAMLFKNKELNIETSSKLENMKADTVVNEMEAEWAKSIRFLDTTSYSCDMKSVTETTDGGYIIGGSYNTTVSLDLGNNVKLPSRRSSYGTGMVIKYDSLGNALWAKAVGAEVNSIINTKDEGYLIVGKCDGNLIFGDDTIITSSTYSKGMIIKCDADGNHQWSKLIGMNSNLVSISSAVETVDGEYLIVGINTAKGNINLGNNVILNNDGNRNEIIIKYDNNGNAQWARKVGQLLTIGSETIIKTQDGGFVLTGGLYGSIDLGNNTTINNEDKTKKTIIKYDSNENIQWTKTISNQINLITDTSDGGYLAVGEMKGNIDLGNNVSISANNGGYDGIIIRYNINGDAQWAISIGGVKDECIKSITQTQDGGYLVVGYFKSASIDLGNGVSIDNFIENVVKGMIIKYDNNRNAQWAKVLNDDYGVYLNLIKETIDGGCIVKGYQFGRDLDLGNNVTISNPGQTGRRELIIKYKNSRDTTPPMVIVSPQDNEYIKTTNITITAIDEGGSELSSDSYYEYYLSTSETELIGGEWTNYTSGEEFTIGEGKTGEYYLFVRRVIDNGGNLSTSEGEIILIGEIEYHRFGPYKFDNTEPTAGTMTMKLNDSEGTTYTNDTWTNQNVYIEPVNGTDKHSGHKSTTYSVSGPIILENQTNPTTLTEEGTYTITVTTTDNTDITSTRAYTVKIDKTAPVLSEITNSSGGNWATQVTISWDITENESGISKVEFSLSGGKTWESLVQKDWYGYTKSNPRNNTVQIRVTDKAGNISNIESTNLKIETTAPTITVNPTSGEYAKSRNVTITVSDTGGSGVSSNNSYQYYLSTSETELIGGEWTNYTPGEEFTLGEGKTGTFYLFVKRVIDNAGNLSTTGGTATTISNVEYQRFGEYKFDNTAPTCRNSNNETRK